MKITMKLYPSPLGHTPANPFQGDGSGGLFSGSIILTPDPLLVHSKLNDINLLNQEVMAATPAASAIQYQFNRFNSGWQHPPAWRNGGDNDAWLSI